MPPEERLKIVIVSSEVSLSLSFSPPSLFQLPLVIFQPLPTPHPPSYGLAFLSEQYNDIFAVEDQAIMMGGDETQQLRAT